MDVWYNISVIAGIVCLIELIFGIFEIRRMKQFAATLKLVRQSDIPYVKMKNMQDMGTFGHVVDIVVNTVLVVLTVRLCLLVAASGVRILYAEGMCVLLVLLTIVSVFQMIYRWQYNSEAVLTKGYIASIQGVYTKADAEIVLMQGILENRGEMYIRVTKPGRKRPYTYRILSMDEEDMRIMNSYRKIVENPDGKYVFLDIDGTLVDGNGEVPKSAVEAIVKARAAGHKIFICSGRSKCEMRPVLTSVPVDGIVASAGAYVEVYGESIFQRPMTPEMNARLLEYFEDRKMAIFLETNDDLLVNDIGLLAIEEHIAWCKEHREPYDNFLFSLAKPLLKVEKPELLKVNKLLFVTYDYTLEQVKADLSDEFTVVDSAIRLPGNSGELSEPGMNKGKGIDCIIQHFHADAGNTIGIGDGENDMEMLSACGIGIAMGNAKPVLKEIADYVTTDVTEDGLKNAFEHYGLI